MRWRGMVGAFAALTLAGCAATGAKTGERGGGNPLFAGADPDTLVVGDTVWLYPTGGWSGRAFGVWSSRDLQRWDKHGPILSLDDVTWIEADGAPEHFAWAPGVAQANGRYYLYYSVGPQNPTPSRIGVAVADRPDGPFVDNGRPLLTGGNGFEAIDAMIFADPKDGKRYLLAGGSAGATLRAFELNPDMISFAREMTIPQPPNFTEGAFMHERGGTYYLSYSHGRWNRDDYSIHYATGPGVTGPWTYRGVLLKSAGIYRGPGHHSFFTDPATGQFHIAYHRWENPGTEPFRGPRRVAIEPVRYRPDGSIEPIEMTRGNRGSTK